MPKSGVGGDGLQRGAIASDRGEGWEPRGTPEGKWPLAQLWGSPSGFFLNPSYAQASWDP